jgi:hypothetical protein
MFSKTKIALAAAISIGAASAALAGESDAAEKWYPETPKQVQQARQATGHFGGDSYGFATPAHKPASRVKSHY